MVDLFCVYPVEGWAIGALFLMPENKAS